MKTLLALLLLISFKVIGGEVKGFKGGMDFDEVLAKVKSKNWNLQKVEDSNTHFIFDKNKQVQLYISFCETNQKVSWLSYSMDSDDIGNYIKLLLNHQQSGWKIKNSIPSNQIGYDGLEYYSLKTVMEGGGYIKEFLVHGSGDIGITSYQIISNYKETYC